MQQSFKSSFRTTVRFALFRVVGFFWGMGVGWALGCTMKDITKVGPGSQHCLKKAVLLTSAVFEVFKPFITIHIFSFCCGGVFRKRSFFLKCMGNVISKGDMRLKRQTWLTHPLGTKSKCSQFGCRSSLKANGIFVWKRISNDICISYTYTFILHIHNLIISHFDIVLPQALFCMIRWCDIGSSHVISYGSISHTFWSCGHSVGLTCAVQIPLTWNRWCFWSICQ